MESSSLVADKEDITILKVDKDKVISSRSDWITRFMSYIGEDGNE